MSPDEELAALRRLAEDEWKFEPFGIRLEGGPADGDRIKTRKRGQYWMIPLPAPIDFSMSLDEIYPTAESLNPVAKYRNTGSMDDDGWIVYEFEVIA